MNTFEESNQVGFSSLLDSLNRRRLEAEVRLVLLGDFAHQTLEGQTADQEFRRLLVAADLTKCNGAWAEAMRLLHAASSGGRFTRGFGRKLLAGSFTTGGFARGLLGTCH